MVLNGRTELTTPGSYPGQGYREINATTGTELTTKRISTAIQLMASSSHPEQLTTSCSQPVPS